MSKKTFMKNNKKKNSSNVVYLPFWKKHQLSWNDATFWRHNTQHNDIKYNCTQHNNEEVHLRHIMLSVVMVCLVVLDFRLSNVILIVVIPSVALQDVVMPSVGAPTLLQNPNWPCLTLVFIFVIFPSLRWPSWATIFWGQLTPFSDGRNC